MTDALRLVCAACGWSPGPPEVDPYPFRCPNAGADDGDHVVAVVAPTSDLGTRRSDDSPPPNPFIRYRTSFYSWHLARSRSIADADYVAIVDRVDAAIASICGTGFRVTPFCRADRLSAALRFDDPSSGIWVKDETGNVSGSHKARHLMGVALYLEVLRHLGIDGDAGRPLAVASCGNAALAAAVVARAIGRRLLVFVPDHASPAVIAQLECLGAIVTRCPRGSGPGDPSYHAFRRAIADGALPFSCQGNENGLAIEGAMTIAYEMADQLSGSATPPVAPVGQGFGLAALDRIFIQTGGGALASACVQALDRCVREGRLAALPRVHAVQTLGGYPLKRAYERFVEYAFERLGESSPGTRTVFTNRGERAGYLLRKGSPALLDAALAYARTHRSQFMWPWETEPRSVAGGILDDETYDWAVGVEGLVRSAGFSLAVDEATLEESNAVARETTGIDVDHTGSSGLAGLIDLTRSVDRPQSTERVAVLFTGIRR